MNRLPAPRPRTNPAFGPLSESTMHLIKEHVFGAVRGIEMGFAPIARLDPRQDRWVKWFTAGNASFANMVRSALRPERLDI